MEAIFFFMLLCFSPFPVFSLDSLKPGETLNSSAYLISSKKIFTLGFYSPDNSNRSYLGIWYTSNYTDTDTPVWIANRNNPIYGNSGSLKISIAGEVIIEHRGGDPIEIYKSETGTNVTATLLDTGNLVVKEMNSSSWGGGNVVWESFDYPTDTLLPKMKLGVNHKTGKNWTLTSWFSASNPASGAFSLEWDWIRRRLLVKRRGVLSWTSGDLKFYYEYGSLKIYSFENIVPKPDPLNLNYIFKNVSNQDEEYFTYSLYVDPFTPENRKIISGWTLQNQGNIYDNDRVYVALVDLCYGYNTRGVGNDVYLGCELWEQPKCRNRHQMFNYTYGRFQFVATYSYDNTSNLTLSDCRANCWNDCKCISYKDEKNGCSYWRGENAELLQDYGPELQLRYFLVSAASEERRRWKIWALPVAIALFLVSIVTASFVIRKFRQAKKKKMKVMQELMTLEGYTGISEFENNGGHDLKMFSYASLLASTHDFSLNNKLGEGGFGSVYKGKTPEGREIAIKILSRSSKQGLIEFKTELILISKLQHRNLVKLLGFCIHGNEKMIVYDYMPNKSLDFFLFDQTKRTVLNWDTRFNIIEGIAQGLLYLHKHSRLLIVHRDLKAGNILLDENMNPKISDFGLSRILKHVSEENTSKRVGTRGYMAPEYVTQGTFSVKSDIYSFGILILEIVSGRRNNSFKNLEGPLTLAEFAWDLWKQCTELELIDPMLKTADKKDQLRKCIQVGLLCVQDKAIDRPFIEDVASMLKSETNSLPVPRKPAFVVRNDGVPTRRKPEPEKFSKNAVSISAMYGR
ncbi:G-type lectin S-receptor-like serine/threonine-protein kinase CES101 [Primulina huaijiensis]|uniref:G-type lectin S-receptor-like serine/threonine-protein kinase CES101 n=1 Tax=Primulina huaijiensis TaxID=1492673 RepID=UPI003CC76484